MIERINQKLERTLFNCGFTVPGVRRIVRDQSYVVALICVLALPLSLLSLWPVHFAIGALLLAVNLFMSARFGHKVLQIKQSKSSAVVGLLLRFYIRLTCTAVIAYILIVHMGVSGLAILAGAVTLATATLLLAWIQFAGRKAKEV